MGERKALGERDGKKKTGHQVGRERLGPILGSLAFGGSPPALVEGLVH